MNQLLTLFELGPLGGLTDGQLLEQFTTRPPGAAEAAFAALVERHGPMVLRVCRGVLADPHDVLDAFQATFLVLVRKARGLWVEDSLGPWLHQVAYRTAACSRSDAARRRKHERRAAGLRASIALDEGEEAGLDRERALHEEIARLPDRYRVPLVLCFLEGLTQEEVARKLRWPIGTVKSRLARARERLRGRLNRRGFGGVSPSRSAESPRASLPVALAGATARAAREFSAYRTLAGVAPTSGVVLAEGVIKLMMLRKWIVALAALLVCGGLATGLGVWAQTPKAREEAPKAGGSPTPKPDGVAVAPKVDDPKTKKAKERIQGAWKVSELHVGHVDDTVNGYFELITFEGDQMYFIHAGKRGFGSTFQLDATEMPRTIDINTKGMEAKGIFEFDGQHLRICYNSQKRPTKFDSEQSKEPPFNVLFELDRE
jgi:RNA polymerase sigma factor (sigma-70 family)